MMKQFESEYIAHWSPAPATPATPESPAQPIFAPATKRFCPSLGSFTSFMGNVTATCDELLPAELEAQEALRSEVELYFELPDARPHGRRHPPMVAKTRSALAESFQDGKTTPRDTGNFSEL